MERIIIDAKNREEAAVLVGLLHDKGFTDTEWDTPHVLRWLNKVVGPVRCTISSSKPHRYYVSSGNFDLRTNMDVDTFIQDYLEYNSY